MSGPHIKFTAQQWEVQSGMPGPYFAVASLSRLLNTHPQ